MSTNNILPEEAAELLTEESLKTIETAFKEKLNLTVESALAQQDELYAEKLEQLIKAIDKDHTAKLKQVVEAIDKDNANKLVKVIKRYEGVLNEEASLFKTKLVESISDYLEEYIDEVIPVTAIEEATKNRTATEVLSNLRKVLAVDSALMSESVKDAVVDGKQQIDALSKKVDELSKENKLLKEQYLTTKSALLLESKTANLSEKKREYMVRVLGDKSPKFIEENFDYTLRLFEKKEKERLDLLKEEAYKSRTVKADAVVSTPAVTTPTTQKENNNPYLAELKRIK